MTTPSATPATGSYTASEQPLGLDKEIKRLQGQATFFWFKEFRNLRLFGLADGMAILEPGSGPGFTSGQILTGLPRATLTGLDLDVQLLDHARQHLSGFGERASFVHASITDTGLPDNSYDFAYARMIFQHLPDPAAAVREMYRVLKPSGRLVILDVDEGLRGVLEPEQPAADAVMQKLIAQQTERGGDRRIGRKLWKLMTAAGFEQLDIEILAPTSDQIGHEAFEWLGGADDDTDMDEYWRVLVERGTLTQAEADIMISSEREYKEATDRYTMFLVMMVGGSKPG